MNSYETESENTEAVTESEGAPEFGSEESEQAEGALEAEVREHMPVAYQIPKPKAAAVLGPEDQGDEGDEGEATAEADAEASAAEESEFETEAGWDESVLTEAEAAEESAEAVTDPWSVEATEVDQQEFFQFLAPLLPILTKTVLPALAQSAAQHLPRLASQIFARLGRRRMVRRETGDEGYLDDAAIEAMAQQLEVIIGTDDRSRILDTRKSPWKRICHLSIVAPNGSKFLGSGALIAPRTVITAGHCVYFHTQGGWAKSITVTPGRNSDTKPFGQCEAIGLRSVEGWTKSRKRDFDYGAIILPPGCLKMTPPSAFGFNAYSDAYLKSKKLNTAGYPGDKAPGTMWYMGRKAKSVTPKTIIYDIDTMGGQSGSPVWVKQGTKRTMVGIHTNGSPQGNSATRITKPVYNNMVSWRKEGA